MLRRSALVARTGRIVGVLAIVAVAAVGGAMASAFGPTLIGAQPGGGQIFGCANNFTGNLRIVYSTGQCTAIERPMNWNQQGPGQVLDREVVRNSVTVGTEDNRDTAFLKTDCPVGYSVVGGGAGRTFSSAVEIVDWYLDASAPGEKGDSAFPDADGWFATFGTLDGEDAVGSYGFFVEAVCVLTAS